MVQLRKHEIASRKRILVAAFVVLIAPMAIAAPAYATPASGFTAAQQWKGGFGDIDLKTKSDSFDLKLDTKGDSDLYVTRNAIAVDGQSGWHTHPGPSLITVTVGEIMAYDSALCQPTPYQTGESFVDPGGGHVHLLRNESGAPAETVAVQFVPKGAVRRIDAPQPNNCNF